MPSPVEAVPLRRFLISWRDGLQPAAIYPVGCLTFDGRYHFTYLAGAGAVQGFRPFMSFPCFDEPYVSPTLFSFFSSRVMDRRRPEREDFLRALDLPADASDLDVLARNEGARKGDRIAVTEAPAVHGDGGTTHTFVVRGLRFAVPDPAARDRILGQLDAGTVLTVRHDVGNTVNPAALLLLAPGASAVGWVPDALVPYVRAVFKRPAAEVVVQRCNGPEQPAHLRLIARLRGTLPVGFVTLPPLAAADNLVATA